MASGDPIDKNAAKLLDAEAALSDGVWTETKHFGPQSVHVSGITTATVKLCGSNAQLKPANSTHGIQIGADITADAIASIAHPLRWTKARISSYASGTISAISQGSR